MEILIDKPAGMSSFGVVVRVRRVLTEQARAEAMRKGLTPPKRVKVGHTGTLDPFATGLLILMTGKDTKRCGEFLKLDKRYEATVRLGATSSTGDPEGEITERVMGDSGAAGAAKIPDLDTVKEAVRSFQGKTRQKVPAYSAVRINGRRAYELARKGIRAEMPEREVEIYEIEIVEYAWPDLKISCHVSSGTYIRALGEDIGEKLGTGGYLTELRRIAIGKYDVRNAKELDSFIAKHTQGRLAEVTSSQ